MAETVEKVFIIGNRFPCCGRRPKGLVPLAGEVFRRSCHGFRGMKHDRTSYHTEIDWTITLVRADTEMRGNVTILKAVYERDE